MFIVNGSEKGWDEILGFDPEEEIDDSCIIYVPVQFFYDWDKVTEDDIRAILKHELGHYYTCADYTEGLVEESFRASLYELILSSHPRELTSSEYHAEYNFFRHQLPSEKTASESVDVTPEDVARIFKHQCGVEPTNTFAGVDTERLLTKPIDLDFSTITQENVADVMLDFISDIVTDSETLRCFPAIVEEWFADKVAILSGKG